MKLIIHCLLAAAMATLATTAAPAEERTPPVPQDSTLTEYRYGHLWNFINTEGFIVGTTMEKISSYGKYYQVAIYLKNLGDTAYTFDPANVFAQVVKEGGSGFGAKVYTYEAFSKKVKNRQKWEMGLYAFTEGLSAGLAGYSYTHTPHGTYTTYSPGMSAIASSVAANNIDALDQRMKQDRAIATDGYLRKHTLYPDEGLIGVMNIKRGYGETTLVVDIVINHQFYTFQWDVGKK